ncbi:hypothetical protein INT48_009440 [Thamnidium elegans]|uniref:Uncharacterized protein n=1 Tax=Thamnidium elegans TaxID=101142 RepID=A0A8H7SRB9_9FUNG|nr:hypothetical protein INT48_009440 [Thamnidium elegans]
MRKRRKVEEHEEGYDYNVPVPKFRKTGRDRVAFKPNDSKFRTLHDNAFKSKVTTIIKSSSKEYSESNVVKLRKKEANRKKVPPEAFEYLDTEYGYYWAANIAKRLKLNTFNLYLTFVNNHFQGLVRQSENQIQLVLQDEQTIAMVVSLNQVLRTDLPSDMRDIIIERLKIAVSQYPGFACIFPFVV